MVAVYNYEIDDYAMAILAMAPEELDALASMLARDNPSLADRLADALIDAVFTATPPADENLTPQMARIYAALTADYGAIVSRQKLFTLMQHGGSTASLEAAISRLRKKLEVETVETVRGRGYKMRRYRYNG